MDVIRSIARFIGLFNEWMGRSVSWLATFLVIVVAANVIMRYFFASSQQWLSELAWHFFAMLFLLGAGYALKHGRHVRVDVIYSRLSEKGKSWIDLGGSFLFLIPFCVLVISRSWDYVLRALPRGAAPEGEGLMAYVSWFIQNAEQSDQPGGIPLRFVIKLMIVLGFFFLLLQALSLFLEALASVIRPQNPDSTHAERTRFRGIIVAVCMLIISWMIIYTFNLQGEGLAVLLFGELFVFILMGFPVAFTLGGAAVIFGFFFADSPAFFNFLPSRIYGIMNREILMAVPLFIYMGIMLEKSGLAERLLETMALLFGRFRGGLALAVIVVGALLAASTGIVGATVVTMGLISLPTMLKRGYSPELATGTIASSGTLGQIIPPSIVLILLSSQLSSSAGSSMATVGDLFKAAVIPSLLLVVGYVLYIVFMAFFKGEKAPAMPPEEVKAFREKGMAKRLIRALLLPLSLIVAVLGSIFTGFASPTEAAAVGALGATLLTAIEGKFNFSIVKDVARETTHLTCMVFLILLGATAFSLVFRDLGGDLYLVGLITDANLPPWAFLLMVMLIIFVAGFFIDFIEIIFIIVPVVTPVFVAYDMDLVWIGILMALNLQTSFLSPPFGFSLFYLKGVAPPSVTTAQIYRGIVPFVLIQLAVLALAIIFPELVIW
jgi:tripartite ATP-independent transporter DctM subunit